VITDLRFFALAALFTCLGPFGLASVADAQQPVVPRHIGVVLIGFSPQSKEVQEFRQGLLDAGYFEGRDVSIEWRYANGDYARMPELVAGLIQSKVEVIVVDSSKAALEAKRGTSTIPIVMAIVSDPLGSGLVTNLAHPDRNVTGLSLMMADLGAKRLQLLKEAVPRLARVAVLWNPDTPIHTKLVQNLKAAALSLSIELVVVSARTPEELDAAFSTASRAHARALYVVPDAFFFSHRTTICKLASKTRLPGIYGARGFADEGGLMSYGPNFGDMFRRTAGYVDKILKGAKPGDLPIEQPKKFEFVVNLKAAKALGLTIPESVLLQADEVIR
jgi:putative ABC transport system substrate-binding protein